MEFPLSQWNAHLTRHMFLVNMQSKERIVIKLRTSSLHLAIVMPVVILDERKLLGTF